MRSAVAFLLVFALALPGAAVAQSEALWDDSQRAAIREYFQKQAQQAAEAERAKKAQSASKDAAATAARKKPEKPKKPNKPEKSKTAYKNKAKGDDKAGDKTKLSAQAAPATLERGQVLPQDLPRRALPKALDSQLGKPAPGTQRVVVGDDVMLIERKTGRILDVVADVAKNISPGR